jgi:hypothetical protein
MRACLRRLGATFHKTAFHRLKRPSSRRYTKRPLYGTFGDVREWAEKTLAINWPFSGLVGVVKLGRPGEASVGPWEKEARPAENPGEVNSVGNTKGRG